MIPTNEWYLYPSADIDVKAGSYINYSHSHDTTAERAEFSQALIESHSASRAWRYICAVPHVRRPAIRHRLAYHSTQLPTQVPATTQLNVADRQGKSLSDREARQSESATDRLWAVTGRAFQLPGGVRPTALVSRCRMDQCTQHSRLSRPFKRDNAPRF